MRFLSLFITVSTDGRQTFTNQQISQSPFIPDANYFFGDYTNISAHNSVIRPVWTRLNGNQQSLWTALLTQNDLVSTETIESPILNATIYPVPVKKNMAIKYKLRNDDIVQIKLYDHTGKLIKVISKNLYRKSGKNREVINTVDLPKGMYLLQLQTSSYVKAISFVKE